MKLTNPSALWAACFGLGLPHLASSSSFAKRVSWSTDLADADCAVFNMSTFATSSDGVCGHLGPDGPWQALSIQVGEPEKDEFREAEFNPQSFLPVYPSLWAGPYSVLLVPDDDGTGYNPNMSRSANTTGPMDPESGYSFDVPKQSYARFEGWSDEADLLWDSGSGNPINMSIAAPKTSLVTLPSFKEYAPTVGYLGLGRGRSSPDEPDTPLLVPQYRAAGEISSDSWSLHMGSASHGQVGSMYLGGYDHSRTLGDVGVFDLKPAGLSIDLVDVTLGVELGASPFNFTESSRSVWLGAGDVVSRRQTGPGGSSTSNATTAYISPESPYMYLPFGNCEVIAEHLPVTWRGHLGLYTWDTDDEDYERIVSSPTYLGFQFSDRDSSELTIKVPFQLLNLTLEAPIVDEPTQYLPCMPFDDPVAILGRTFLQAAFLLYNNEKNVTYMSQAPGPQMTRSVMKTFNADDDGITSRPIDDFQLSWNSTWKPLEDELDGADGEEASDDDDNDDEGSSDSESAGASGGAIAGGVVGSVAATTMLSAALWLYWRRRKARQAATGDGAAKGVSNVASEKGGSEIDGNEVIGSPTTGSGDIGNGKYGYYAPHEQTPGHEKEETQREVDQPKTTLEFPGDNVYAEMDASNMPAELSGHSAVPGDSSQTPQSPTLGSIGRAYG